MTMEASEIRRKMKHKFTDSINKKETKANSALLTNDKYLELIKDVRRAKECQKKVPRDYWLLRHYDVLVIRDIEKLIVPMKETDSETVFYVTKDDLFDVLYGIHLATGHGGRDRMVKELNRKYKNITRVQIKSFLENCEACQQKKKSKQKTEVAVNKPTVFHQLNSRCQVDLIDCQSHPDGKYKFIMVYQDHLTKFLVLKPLETKCAHEVTSRILEIFLLFGAPSILQSDNGREFCSKMIESLQDMWPELKIVHGKSRHSVERANQDVKNMLSTWMQQNGTNKWSKGLQFVQFMKNCAYHSDIKKTPYKAMFGVDPKVGLSTSSLPKEMLDPLQDEEDLNRVLQSMKKETEELSTEDKDKENNDNTEEDLEEIEDIKCVICLKKCSESHSPCTDCFKPVHVTCAIEIFNEDADGTDQNRRCVLCHRKTLMANERNEAKESLCQPTKRMKTTLD